MIEDQTVLWPIPQFACAQGQIERNLRSKGGFVDAFFEKLGEEHRIIRCQPYASRWKTFADAYALNWQIEPFRAGGANAVPESAGFYCFIVMNRWGSLPAVLYPLYAGETVNLRRRYRDYLREMKDPKGRFHVRKFLLVFAGETKFCFAPFDADKDGLRTIEKKLNDALMPPYSHRDFSAEVKAPRGAWQ
jgi:hypothetical protein